MQQGMARGADGDPADMRVYGEAMGVAHTGMGCSSGGAGDIYVAYDPEGPWFTLVWLRDVRSLLVQLTRHSASGCFEVGQP